VSLLGRKKDTTAAGPSTSDEDATVVVEPEQAESAATRKTTAPKGRPTPKRDAAKRRGPVAPAPMTSAEARRRRKEIRGQKLSRAERKELKAVQRERMADRRARMMAGEEGYLLPRDRGPVRRYVRDVVDSRRNLLGLFMPIAFALVFIMIAVPVPEVQLALSPGMMVLVVVMLVDAVFLGRRVNRLVDAKFPKNTESGWRLGFYATSRASQLRRMRAPRPQVKRGEKVT
jgi:hypothetical protein